MAPVVREIPECGRAVICRGEEARAVLERSSWLESKDSEGGTALRRIDEQIALARERVSAGG